MFAIIASTLVLVLAVAIVRWIAAVPLVRTLTASIDCWADSAQDESVDREDKSKLK